MNNDNQIGFNFTNFCLIALLILLLIMGGFYQLNEMIKLGVV